MGTPRLCQRLRDVPPNCRKRLLRDSSTTRYVGLPNLQSIFSVFHLSKNVRANVGPHEVGMRCIRMGETQPQLADSHFD
jgi:hypothetical protein